MTSRSASTPEEVWIDEPTRSARLKWVIVVDEAQPAGRAVDAAVCVSAGTAARVAGLLGPDAQDAGCTARQIADQLGHAKVSMTQDRHLSR